VSDSSRDGFDAPPPEHPGEEVAYRYVGPPLLELRRWPVDERRWMHRWDQQGRLPGVVVVATDGRGVLLIRQYREAVGASLWQLPRGYRDADDVDALAAARRELEEETGIRSGTGAGAHPQRPDRVVGRLWVDPGLMSTGVDVVAVHLDGFPAGLGESAAAEGIHGRRVVALDDIPSWIARGDLTDALTIAATTLYLATPGRGPVGGRS
jgi:8-oxo-dGTP pyrophosphatase MutT (NUDIX family)